VKEESGDLQIQVAKQPDHASVYPAAIRFCRRDKVLDRKTFPDASQPKANGSDPVKTPRPPINENHDIWLKRSEEPNPIPQRVRRATTLRDIDTESRAQPLTIEILPNAEYRKLQPRLKEPVYQFNCMFFSTTIIITPRNEKYLPLPHVTRIDLIL
jgi:hypothetical protein